MQLPPGMCAAEVMLMQVKELREALAGLRLSSKGKKAELLARLIAVVPAEPIEPAEPVLPHEPAELEGCSAAAELPSASAPPCVPPASNEGGGGQAGARSAFDTIDANSADANSGRVAAGGGERKGRKGRRLMSSTQVDDGWAHSLLYESGLDYKYNEGGETYSALYGKIVNAPPPL